MHFFTLLEQIRFCALSPLLMVQVTNSGADRNKLFQIAAQNGNEAAVAEPARFGFPPLT